MSVGDVREETARFVAKSYIVLQNLTPRDLAQLILSAYRKAAGWAMFRSRRQRDAPVRRSAAAPSEGAEFFRRSRTLTGSTSTRVMSSAGEVHHDLRSPRQRHHELKRHRRTLSVAWLGSALVIGLMLWLPIVTS